MPQRSAGSAKQLILAMTAAVLLASGALPPRAHAQTSSQAELTFWQSIQTSKDPEEYKAYLQAYPDGLYAPIAKLRIRRLAAGGGQDAGQGTGQDTGQDEQAGAPAASQAGAKDGAPDTQAAAPDDEGDSPDNTVSFTIEPTRARLGQPVTITPVNLPQGTVGRDLIIVVHAGAPDSTGLTSTGGSNPAGGIFDSQYASNFNTARNGQPSYQAGPFAPGRYEVRWLTTLFNNDNRLELKARAPFSVR